MKSLSEFINEGVFNDNIKSAIKINGVTIYEPDWKKCEEYYQKRRKKYFGNKSNVTLGDLDDEYEVVYNEDDCIVAVEDIAVEDIDNYDIYILCPETIYMRHEAQEICNGRQYTFSLTDIDDANDFDICFNWDPYIKWLSIGDGRSSIKKLEDAGWDSGLEYIPGTISKKAQDIIKKYMKV
jgi:uncharacterized protein (DUF779 family)